MSKADPRTRFKYRVAYRHKLLVDLRRCAAFKKPYPFGVTEEGIKHGITDLVMEEVLLLLGEISEEEIMGANGSATKEWPVDCDEHGRQPCYCVCVHVAESGAKVHFVEKASMDNIGQICCSTCASGDNPLSEDMAVIVCAECALLKGWLSGGIQ